MSQDIETKNYCADVYNDVVLGGMDIHIGMLDKRVPDGLPAAQAMAGTVLGFLAVFQGTLKTFRQGCNNLEIRKAVEDILSDDDLSENYQELIKQFLHNQAPSKE